MPRPYYETDRAAGEYLLLHYGGAGRSNFPANCVRQCLEAGRLPGTARGLDLGCAVGRSAFELARHCAEVVGIDYSARFIALARQLQKNGFFPFQTVEEGEIMRARRAIVPKGIDRGRVRFQRGDAMNLSPGLGRFDVVVMANLIDRLADPRKCLAQMRQLVKPGGQLILTSPYTWLVEYTPRRRWLGSFLRGGRPVKTFDTLRQILSPHFRLVRRRDLPFLIREHARKYQFGLAEGSVWLRRFEPVRTKAGAS
jgi:putative 4-mercaptohistidine N1-methyltranferase